MSSQFFVAGQKVGILTPKVVEELQRYPHVFEISLNPNISPQKTVQMSDKYASYDERTKVMSKVIEDMAQRDAHIALRGWRNEVCQTLETVTANKRNNSRYCSINLMCFFSIIVFIAN